MEWEKVMNQDSEILHGLSHGELEALADGLLAPSLQLRLDELIARAKEGQLSSAEEAELDSMLARTDQLMIVKTRARYTLQRQHAGALSR